MTPLYPVPPSTPQAALDSPSNLEPKNEKAQSEFPSSSSASVAGDDCQLSSEGQSLTHLLRGMQNLPEIRQERITQLQKAIQEGSYKVSPEDLAKKIIQEL